MYQRSKKFGQLSGKSITLSNQDIIHDVQAYYEEAETKASRAAAWLSYFTLVYAGIVAFAPSTATAAVMTLKYIAG